MTASEGVFSLYVSYWLGRNPHSLICPQFRETWNTFPVPSNSFTRKELMTHSASTCWDNTRDCHSKMYTKFSSRNGRAEEPLWRCIRNTRNKVPEGRIELALGPPAFQGGGHQIHTLHIKGKAIPLQAWRGPECSRSLRLPDFKTISTWRW